MAADRKGFLERVAAATALPPRVGLVPAGFAPHAPEPPWLKRLRGTYRAVFDNPRDDGAGIARAWIWMNQCRSILGSSDEECSTAVVLRHGGITLAMNDAFWAEYQITQGPSSPENPTIPGRNPQLAAAMKGAITTFPPPARPFVEGIGLDALIDRGGVVLGCEFAFYGMISRVMQHDRLDEGTARIRATGYLLPGVTLVPSGFFALALAQQQGCSFVTNI
jgi:hypothetical protein